jgi:RimJ/RimL family protein N-acetyltransferase
MARHAGGLTRLQPGGAVARRAERLFRADVPAMPRLSGVLDGSLTGEIWADSATEPAWAMATELVDGTTWIAGRPSPAAVATIFERLRPTSAEIVVGLDGLDDGVAEMLPPNHFYQGEAIDFTERLPTAADGGPPPLRDGHRLVAIDDQLIQRTEWFADTLRAFGSLERWRATGLGWCVLVGEVLASEATTGPPIRGTIELGVFTNPAFRGQGLATVVARQLVLTCESRGLRPWWNANIDNRPSLAVARRIGFSRERTYRLRAWHARP